jgi:glucose-1-phosphate cytidylyltransferase
LSYVEDEDFCFTYGDGLSDVDITAAIAFHREQGTKATVTAVHPAGRFGAIDVDGERVSGFEEKPRGDRAWTNGGFFVLSPDVAQYLDGGDELVWEQQPMRALAADGELSAFRHDGFWQPMDTLRDRRELEELWDSGRAPWRMWT